MEQVVHSREKKGGSSDEKKKGGSGDDDSFRKWNGYEKGFRFVSEEND